MEVNHLDDERDMRWVIELAENGVGFVSPNPMVGAVVVKDGRRIGEGWHEVYGKPHAERNALANCAEDPKGATMYVNLEPCCHHGKTPPCTDAIIESGIKRVVVGSLDPNPKVSGKGVEALEKAGIDVTVGVLEAHCRNLNEVFYHYMEKNEPFVTMKYAMTADGKIATVSGASQWITSDESRQSVHKDRHRYMSIMVGIGTVLADDPMLTCRIEGCKNPVRIICDTNLRLPTDSNIAKTARDVRTIVATSCADTRKRTPLLDLGCEIMDVPRDRNQIDLKRLMGVIAEIGIDSVLLEGGGDLNFSALRSGIVNKVKAYIAPKIFGGATAKSPVGGEGFATVANCIKLQFQNMSYFGEDIQVVYKVERLGV